MGHQYKLIKLNFMSTQELFEQINQLFTEFSEYHAQSTKVSHGKARKSLSQMKKLLAAYNKSSVLEDKTK